MKRIIAIIAILALLAMPAWAGPKISKNGGGAAGTGSVATDTIWDAAGDLAIGTGANTAGRLAVGATNTLLYVNSDTPAWLALGAANTVLTSNGSALAWASTHSHLGTSTGYHFYGPADHVGFFNVNLAGSTTDKTMTIVSSQTDNISVTLPTVTSTLAILGANTFTADQTLNTTSKVQFGDSGTYINQSADGVLAIVSDTEAKLLINDEDLKFTKTGSNGITIGSNTSVDTVTMGAINLVTTGTIQGAVKYVAVTSADGDDAYTIATADGYGIMVTNAGDDDALTVTLPDVAVGMSVCVGVVAAFAVTIEPNGSERIIVDTNTNGDYMTNAGTAGDFYCLMGISATEWMPLGKKGTWTEQ